MLKAEFWLDKWEKGEIGFHQNEINANLKQYWSTLNLEVGDVVFVPLCGKTNDIAWLLAQGFKVVGVELSASAIESLFEALKTKPTVTDEGHFRRFTADNITIFQGDFFKLTTSHIGSVQAIYDRAALVALPLDMRQAYTARLMEITQKAPQLLVTLSYDQSLLAGPPFSVTPSEVQQHYENAYHIVTLKSDLLPEGFKTVQEVTQAVWCLRSTALSD